MKTTNYFLDVETYLQYDGDNEADIIKTAHYFNKDVKKEDLIIGKYYPTLNSNNFVLGGIQDNKGNSEYFENKEMMYQRIMEIIEQHDHRVQFWGHNHEYDIYAYFKEHLQEEITNNNLYWVRPKPLIAIYKKYNRFSDTMAYYPMSLRAIGEELLSEKLELPEHFNNVKELYSYLEQDLTITRKAVETVFETLKECGYKPHDILTPGKTATNWLFNYIGKQDNSGWVLKGGSFHRNEETIQLVRQASKGGVNEAYERGYFNLCSYIDRNSAYWKSMQDMPFPDLLKERYYPDYLCEHFGTEQILDKTGVVHCTIQATESKIGLLATRIKDTEGTHHIAFPHNGETIKGYWTTAEINYAISQGYKLRQIHEAVIYLQDLQFNYLGKFIGELYEHRKRYRKEGNKIKEKLLKLIGNSLYGKFIQHYHDKEYKWIERKDIDDYLDQGWNIESTSENYCISKEKEPYIPRYTSIILGVLISAYARIDILKTLQRLDGKGKYVDTDGIIIEGTIPEWIPIGDQLGQYKIEWEDEVHIIKNKVYTYGERVKAAGLRRTPNAKEKLLKGEPIEMPSIIGLADGARTGDFSKVGTFTTITKTYQHEEKEELPLYIEEPEVK